MFYLLPIIVSHFCSLSILEFLLPLLSVIKIFVQLWFTVETNCSISTTVPSGEKKEEGHMSGWFLKQCLVSSVIFLVIVDFCVLYWLSKTKTIFDHLPGSSDWKKKKMRKTQFTRERFCCILLPEEEEKAVKG